MNAGNKNLGDISIYFIILTKILLYGYLVKLIVIYRYLGRKLRFKNIGT